MKNLINLPVTNEDQLLIFLLNNKVGLRATYVKRETAHRSTGLLLKSRSSVEKRIRYFENKGAVYALLYIEPDSNNRSQSVARIVNVESDKAYEAATTLLEVSVAFQDDPNIQIDNKGQAQLLLFEAMANKNAETKDHFQEAIKLSERAIALDPTLAQALNCKGASQAALGDSVAAIATYLAAIKADPRCTRPWLNLGNRYTALDEKDRALFAYRISVERAPLWEGDEELQAEALVKLTSTGDQSPETIHLLLARNEEIDQLFDDHQFDNRSSGHSAVATGVRLGRQGEWEKALEFFSVAAAANTDDIAAHNNRAHALNQLGRHNEAIAVCDDVLARYPDYFTVTQTKAEALLMEGRVEESLSCLNKILYSDGSNPAVNHFKALIEDELGLLSNAVETYGRLLQPDIKSCEPQREYATRRIQEFLYYGDRSITGSTSSAERSLHVNGLLDCFSSDDKGGCPPDIAAGLDCFKNGDLDATLSHCDKVLLLDPDHLDALVLKADALMQRARNSGMALRPEHPLCSEALECLARAAGRDPRHPGVIYSKALVEDALGARELASRTFRQFVVVAPDTLASHLHYARTRLHHMEFWRWQKKMSALSMEAGDHVRQQ